jgi:hypothetical protein
MSTSRENLIEQLDERGALEGNRELIEFILSSPDKQEALDALRRRWLKSEFDPYLLFVSGPGANNLVLSFFLSNPDMSFSREDVFAHLNRHCEEQGINEYFESANWIGYEFSTTGLGTGLKIGRSSVLRTISNLDRLGLLEKNDADGELKGKFRLSKNEKTASLLELRHFMREDESYRQFNIFKIRRLRARPTYDQSRTFEELADVYAADLFRWEGKSSDSFRSKLARLSFYCEHENANFSTRSRAFNKLLKMNLDASNKRELLFLIKRLDPESLTTSRGKKKSELIDLTLEITKKKNL